MVQSIEKVARTVISPLLSDVQFSIETKMFGQVRTMVGSQLPDTDIFVNTARTKRKQGLPLHPQLSPCKTYSGYSLEDVLNELTQDPDRATEADAPKVHPTGLWEPTRIGEESVVRQTKI